MEIAGRIGSFQLPPSFGKTWDDPKHVDGESAVPIALIAFVSAHQMVSGIIVSRRGYRVEVSQGTHHV